jgi:hypothetical protein
MNFLRILLATLVLANFAVASTSVSKKLKPKTKSTLSTNVNFEDQLVNGKYAYPDEALATVEDEKLLNDLLAVRKNFKDRLKQTSMRN